jgi:ferredoxin-NADP reductase
LTITDTITTVPLRLARKQQLAEGIISLSFILNGLGILPTWTPGAHVDLHLPGGYVRQYSLCGDPADGSAWRVAVLREPGGRGGSAAAHDLLAEGDELTASAPRNHFELDDADSYLFIAGGIGITPILSMVAEAERRGRRWELAYGGRSRASMAFLDELAAYGDKVTVRPQDRFGLLDLDALLGEPHAGTAVYCCGPPPLLAAVAERCQAWPAGALRVERFAADEGVTSHEGETFEVELASCGRVIGVPAGQSVLTALRGAGFEVLSSCEEGTCGTCETPVLAGVPDHRDAVLTPAERAAGDIMMVCVSRSKTPRLVLDL